MAVESPTKKRTNAQMALPELFAVEMTDQEVDELRRLLMQHYRTKLEAEVDRIQQETGRTTVQME